MLMRAPPICKTPPGTQYAPVPCSKQPKPKLLRQAQSSGEAPPRNSLIDAFGSYGYHPGMRLGFTQTLSDVLRVADEQARGLNHDFVGTEHLLLGILAGDQKSIA